MVLLLVTVVKVGIVVCTFVGNLFVIVAILIDKNLQTAGNQLVLSLAVADLMVGCLVMPLGTYNDYHQGWWLGTGVCEFWTCADVLCCTASILNLLAIALDRYWAVTNVDYIYKRTWKRVTMMIVCAWAVGAVVSLAPIFGWKDPDFGRRVLHDHKCLPSQDVGYQIFATISTFYAPLVLLLALYWRIFKVARKRIHCKPGRKSGGPQQLVAAASSSILGGGGKLGARLGPSLRAGQEVEEMRPEATRRATTTTSAATESIVRRPAQSGASQTALDQQTGTRRQLALEASGESNFEGNSIEAAPETGDGGDSRRRATNDAKAVHNGDAGMKGVESAARSQVVVRLEAAAATDSVGPKRADTRKETNDSSAKDIDMNEKQICSARDRVAPPLPAEPLPVTGGALQARREAPRRPLAATGDVDDQFLSPRAAANEANRERDVRGEAHVSRNIIERSVSLRRARRPPPTSADDVLRLLGRCAPNRLRAAESSSFWRSPAPAAETDANDRRPASMAAHLEAAERLAGGERARAWRQSGERQRSLVQLNVQMLSRDLDHLASHRSTSNSLSDCGYCCCCLHGAEHTDQGALTSDDEEGEARDFRWPRRAPQQAAEKSAWRSSCEQVGGFLQEHAPDHTTKRAERKQHPSLPFTTSMSISSSSSSPSASNSSSPSSSSSSSLSPSSRSMLAAAAAAELELALDEQIRLEFQFNDELRSSSSKQIARADDKSNSNASISERRPDGGAAAGGPQEGGARAQLQPLEEPPARPQLNFNNRSNRTSAIRRRFRALGQLVSFVQTSRQFNSSSSTQTSQSGDEEHQRQLAGEQRRETGCEQVSAAAAAASLSHDGASQTTKTNGSQPPEEKGNGEERSRRESAQTGRVERASEAIAPCATPPSIKSPAPQLAAPDRTTGTSQQQRRQNLEMKREKKAAKTLAIITGVFVCCWLPFFLNAIVMPVCGELCTPSDPIQSVLLWLGYLNSLLNPIIYTIFSPDFRRAFHRLLSWPDGRQRAPAARCGPTKGKATLKKTAGGSGKSSSELSLAKRKSTLSRLA